jgi:hypothetical protein
MKKQQLYLMHEYPRLARLSEPERRDLLKRKTGVASCADPSIKQRDFEVFMAAAETLLWRHVHDGEIPDPRTCCGKALIRNPRDWRRGRCPACGRDRRVCCWSETYWRDKQIRPGLASTRQIHRLRNLWDLLKDYLGPQPTDAYLACIIAKSAGRRLELLDTDQKLMWNELPSWSAHMAIEALQDRLKYAVKKQEAA